MSIHQPLKTMSSTLTSDNISNPGEQKLCTNCMYGNYWVELHILSSHQVFGFDCNYPNMGSKPIHNTDSKLVSDDENIAEQCPKYQLVDPIN
jgi:hypothetical protein